MRRFSRAERGAVLLREKNSGVYMLYARDYAPGEALLNLLLERDDVRELSVTRADLCRKAEELLGLRLDFEYYHVAYLENRPPEPAGRLEIRTPSEELAGVIADHYEHLNEEQVIAPYPPGTPVRRLPRGQTGGLHRGTPRGQHRHSGSAAGIPPARLCL